MPYGLSEHGYTIDSATRKAHHAAHENSTAFLSLTDAICRRRFSKEYKMRFYVVCCLPEPWMVGLAEHLITVIGQGYVRNGGGLNYHLAGLSIMGVENLIEFQKRAHRDWVDENINQDGNSKTLLAALIKHVKALDGLSYDLTYKSKRHDELMKTIVDQSFELDMLLREKQFEKRKFVNKGKRKYIDELNALLDKLEAPSAEAPSVEP